MRQANNRSRHQRKTRCNQHKQFKKKQHIKLTPLEKMVVCVHRTEYKIFRPLRKYNAFINRKKWIKLPIQLIGWGTLIYVLFNIGLNKLTLAFTGLFNVQTALDALIYAWDLKDALLSASPVKNQLEILLSLIFGVGSFGFILNVVDVEKYIERSAFENTRFPAKRVLFTFAAAYSNVNNLLFPFIFISLLSVLLVMFLWKYQMIVSQRKDPARYERTRLILQEQKLVLRNKYIYHIFTGEVNLLPSRVPL